MENVQPDPVNEGIAEYKRLLEERYDDVPDDWDMYEDMSALKEHFRNGGSAEAAIAEFHGIIDSGQA